MSLRKLKIGSIDKVANYEENEIKKLMPVDEYGIKFQLSSADGKTKWLPLANKFSFKLIEKELSEGGSKIQLSSSEGKTKWLELNDATFNAIKPYLK